MNAQREAELPAIFDKLGAVNRTQATPAPASEGCSPSQ